MHATLWWADNGDTDALPEHAEDPSAAQRRRDRHEAARALGPRLVALTTCAAGGDDVGGSRQHLRPHPAPWTLELLRNAGMVAGRTDRDGDLAAAVEGGRLRLVARKGPPTAAGVGSGRGEAGPVSPAGSGGRVRRGGGRRFVGRCRTCRPPPPKSSR